MKGIIYTRVSSDEQVKGTSLEFQEEVCRKYCREKGIEVFEVFREEGASAKSADRAEFLRAIELCRKHKGEIDAFVVAKVDRFARNTEDHFYIRKMLLDYGATLHSVSEPIGNSPVGKIFETMLAGFAEFDNSIRKQRCSDGMASRLKQGICPWNPPLGYACGHFKRRGEKKTEPDKRDEKVFPIIQRALKEYANGMCSQIELAELLDKWGLAAIRGKPTSPQMVDSILGRYLKFYAGILVNPWTAEEFKGRHEPMIDEREMRQILLVRSGKAVRKMARNRYNPEFPLKRTAICISCGNPLTGSVAHGNGGAYSFYHCFKQGCPLRGKTIPKGDIEKHFVARLAEVTPKKKVIAVIMESLMEVWREKGKQYADEAHRRADAVAELEVKKKRVYEMREDGTYTKEEFIDRKAEVENQIAVAEISVSEAKIDQYDVEALLTYADKFTENLGRQWVDMPNPLKPRFQKFVFPEGIGYEKGIGFRTAKTASIFELCERYDAQKSKAVDHTGFEPVASSLQMRRSTN
jgi:site-specific DNA recombinase